MTMQIFKKQLLPTCEGRPCRSESGVIASNGDLWGLIHRGRIIGPAIFI